MKLMEMLFVLAKAAPTRALFKVITNIFNCTHATDMNFVVAVHIFFQQQQQTTDIKENAQMILCVCVFFSVVFCYR